MRKATSWRSLAPSDSLLRPADVQVHVPVVVFAQCVLEDEVLDLLDAQSGFLKNSDTLSEFRSLISGAYDFFLRNFLSIIGKIFKVCQNLSREAVLRMRWLKRNSRSKRNQLLMGAQ